MKARASLVFVATFAFAASAWADAGDAGDAGNDGASEASLDASLADSGSGDSSVLEAGSDASLGATPPFDAGTRDAGRVSNVGNEIEGAGGCNAGASGGGLFAALGLALALASVLGRRRSV